MSNSLRDFALKMCPHVCVISHRSIKKHFGNQADSFDYDMAAYCALGFLLTYVVAYLPDEAASD